MRAIYSENQIGYIGLNGELPWKCSADLKHFKKFTYGNNLLAGVNTFNKLPNLPGRNVIVDKNELPEVVQEWIKRNPNIINIGGRKTLEKYCHLFTELHISHITNDFTIGDTFKPLFLNLNPQCKIFNYYFEVDK